MYCFKAYSVRTYNRLRNKGITIINEADCIEIADGVLLGYIKGELKMAAELYRAGGLGIYPIYERMHGQLPLETIARECAKWDVMHHQAMRFEV